MLFVHGSPRRINEYLFPDRPDENLLHVTSKESVNFLVCSHTHRPFSRKVQSIWFVKVGSVGRPKDGDWRAGWGLLTIHDNHALKIELRRCEYDLEILKTAYTNSKLPIKYYLDLLSNKRL